MRFEVSERIRTSSSQEDLLRVLEDQFRKVSKSAYQSGQTIVANSIEDSFGAVTRKDETVISLRQAEDGWLVIANVSCEPSFAFWVILIITFFTWIFWLLPIGAYFYQKTAIQKTISDCFLRVKNEFDQTINKPTQITTSSTDEIEKLGALKEKGLITDSEFDAKKKQLLGL